MHVLYLKVNKIKTWTQNHKKLKNCLGVVLNRTFVKELIKINIVETMQGIYANYRS